LGTDAQRRGPVITTCAIQIQICAAGVRLAETLPIMLAAGASRRDLPPREALGAGGAKERAQFGPLSYNNRVVHYHSAGFCLDRFCTI